MKISLRDGISMLLKYFIKNNFIFIFIFVGYDSFSDIYINVYSDYECR